MVSFRLDPPRPVLKKISTAKIYFPNKVNTGELKISEHISTAEAEIKKKRGQLSLLRSRLGRSCCPTPSTHRRFTTGESPESTENSRATDNVSPAQVDALKAEIMELEGNLTSLRQSVFDTFEQLLAVSLQAPFRKIVAEQCDSADYVDPNGKRVICRLRGRVLSAFQAVAIAWLRLHVGEEDAYEVTLRLLQNLLF